MDKENIKKPLHPFLYFYFWFMKIKFKGAVALNRHFTLRSGLTIKGRFDFTLNRDFFNFFSI